MAFENIKVTDMHTGGEPLRIVDGSVLFKIKGDTLLEKRLYFKTHWDRFRTILMSEPRGHQDMYGAILVPPDQPEAHIGVLFTHNEGYSTMCGHGVIALGRYAVDRGLVPCTPSETVVNIQCPCGLGQAIVREDGSVRFTSVPAFVRHLDIKLDLGVSVDICYGGAFYAVVRGSLLGLNVPTSDPQDFIRTAKLVKDAVLRSEASIDHPDSPDLGFLYGVIFTDELDSPSTSQHVCVFADNQIDRSPTGSGVTARVALLVQRGHMKLGEKRVFSGILGTQFSGEATEVANCGGFLGVRVQVSGKAYYTGTSEFTIEPDDPLGDGFLLRQ